MRPLMRDALLVAVTSISTALLTRSFLVSAQNPAVAISGVHRFGEEVLFPSGIPFGSSPLKWRSASVLETDNNSLHQDSRSTVTVRRQSAGSGKNGPGYSDAAAYFASEKHNYLTTKQEGEIDGMYVAVTQGVHSDAGGINVNVRKALDAVSGTGGALAMETSTSWTDQTGLPRQQVQSVIGFLEGRGGVTRAGGSGFYTEPRVGNIFTAFAGVGRSDIASHFDNLIIGARNRQPQSIYFRVDGEGNLDTKGGIRLGTGARLVRIASEIRSVDFAPTDNTSTERGELLLANVRKGDAVILTPAEGNFDPEITFYGWAPRDGIVEITGHTLSTKSIKLGARILRITVLGF